MNLSVDPSKYQDLSFTDAKFLAQRGQGLGQRVYVIDHRLVTEVRTYWVSDTQLEGPALARKLGVRTVDEAGEFTWPRHPVVEWVIRNLTTWKKEL